MSSLCQPPENDLSDRLAVLFCNRYKDFVMEDIVLSLGERTPRFDLDVVFFEKLLCFNLLMERVRFDLVDGWQNLVDER